MTTGYLAARSLLGHGDYDALWQAHLMPQLKAATVNRMLFQMVGNAGYKPVLWYSKLYQHQARRLCHRHYQPMLYTHLLWSLARRKVLDEQQRHDEQISQAMRRKAINSID